MKRTAIAAAGLVLVTGIVLGAMLGNPFGASADPAAPNPGHAWTELEYHGSDGAGQWLGTTINQALELRVNSQRALRVVPNATSPNIIGGYSGNIVTDGVAAAAICGGGSSGYTNRVTDSYGTIGGGTNNQAGDNAGTPTDASYATVGGGRSNTASVAATVGGGLHNTASSVAATVGGGEENTASSVGATVGGGNSNSAGNDWATVGGGWSNNASGTGATVGGGYDNNASSYVSTVGGGQSNSASYTATVGGGYYNNASANGSTVGGGEENTASGYRATVGGGYNNTASGNRATVGGGDSNSAGNDWSTAGGGFSNDASGPAATVGGGYNNTASGDTATVPGGGDNAASGDFSFAAGRRAKANHEGSFVWADASDTDFASSGPNQFRVLATGGAAFFSGIFPSVGVSLPAGGNAWAPISDRSVKANFEGVDGQDILERLTSVPVETWNLKSQDESIRHIGPMAQDFYAAFGVGEDDKYITTSDADGVALAAIQGLYELSQEKDVRIRALEEENATLHQRLDALEARVGGLEARSRPESVVSAASSSGLPDTWLLLGGGLALVFVGLALVGHRLVGTRR